MKVSKEFKIKKEDIINTTKSLDSNNLFASILYRNANVIQSSKTKRNAQGMLSTEGIISIFFNNVMESKLKNTYLDDNFYHDYYANTNNCQGKTRENI